MLISHFRYDFWIISGDYSFSFVLYELLYYPYIQTLIL